MQKVLKLGICVGNMRLNYVPRMELVHNVLNLLKYGCRGRKRDRKYSAKYLENCETERPNVTSDSVRLTKDSFGL